ncbi:MAG: DUF1015 domain-containing protein [Flavobacteriales bacterium]|nr:DUF1015 domain-containing protein [Flavobacteriales bacterium]
MAKIKPFKAIRPTRDKANLVASRSYLSYSDESLKEKLDNNPFTFLHIINPDYNQKKKNNGIDKFDLVKGKFNTFVSDKTLFEEEKESIYIYQQIKEDVTFTGFIAATSVDDYLDGKIKIHEQTLTKREKMFKNYLQTTGFNAEPVLLTYSDNSVISGLISEKIKNRAEYEFTTTNKVCHKLWVVNNSDEIKVMVSEFSKINKIYIADGHHRSASSALLCQNIRKENTEFNPEDNFNFFMSYFIEESQLRIINFNRLIKHTNGQTANELIYKIEGSYSVKKMGKEIYSPTLKNEISMYFGGNWYSLIAHSKKYNSTSESLDPFILSESILSPILGIADEKTDSNISFYDGTIPLDELRKKVDNQEYSIAFILKPIDIESLKKVADNNEIMPPKSTYIEPKLRSGLTIYKLD